MLLLVCATALELNAFPESVLRDPGISTLRCGVGPVESTLSLCRFLAGQKAAAITGVVNFGVGGVYPDCGLSVLDLCFAESETLGDLAICTGDGFIDLPDSLALVRHFVLENSLLAGAEKFCRSKGDPFHKGPFVTLCCASGSEERGRVLQKKYGAICENMEGAALARVCQEFGLPFLEVRSISNVVENRDLANWQLQAAADRAAAFAAEFALFLLNAHATT